MGEKVLNNYLMGLIFSTSWRVAPNKNQNPYRDMDFSKNFSKVADFSW